MGDLEQHPVDDARAERGRAMVAAAVAQTHAPLALRERIEAQRRPRDRRRWALGGSLAGAVAAAVVAIVVATGGGVAEPTVAKAAQLALRAPTAGAPAVDRAHPGLLERSVGGVAYPSWQDKFPWKASGVREDKLDGQRAVTVFYDDPSGTRIGYTILAGKPVDEPSGQSFRHGPERYVLLQQGARKIVTWRRGGHTCVLSAPRTVPSERLLALASWSGSAPASSNFGLHCRISALWR
jgi:hypothetical protein